MRAYQALWIFVLSLAIIAIMVYFHVEQHQRILSLEKELFFVQSRTNDIETLLNIDTQLNFDKNKKFKLYGEYDFTEAKVLLPPIYDDKNGDGYDEAYTMVLCPGEERRLSDGWSTSEEIDAIIEGLESPDPPVLPKEFSELFQKWEEGNFEEVEAITFEEAKEIIEKALEAKLPTGEITPPEFWRKMHSTDGNATMSFTEPFQMPENPQVTDGDVDYYNPEDWDAQDWNREETP